MTLVTHGRGDIRRSMGESTLNESGVVCCKFRLDLRPSGPPSKEKLGHNGKESQSRRPSKWRTFAKDHVKLDSPVPREKANINDLEAPAKELERRTTELGTATLVVADSFHSGVPMDSPAEPPLAPFKNEVLGALISGVPTLATTRTALEGHTELGPKRQPLRSERNLLVLFEAGVTLDADINVCACAKELLLRSLAQDNERRIPHRRSLINTSMVAGSFRKDDVLVCADRSSTKPASLSVGGRRLGIRVWTWPSSSVTTHRRSALYFILRLSDVFVDSTIGTDADAAKAFVDIAASNSVLTKRNGAIVKFATGILPRLMSGAKDNSEDSHRVLALSRRAARCGDVRRAASVQGGGAASVHRDALNDPKRGVRREAVDAREVWFKYNG
ncbi:hypothetical protein B0H13DRAFT_1872929 [Mycena leptocephala]|nr:hypothetical protein B0H13DRAFT_1872929 [Mycena leptocephala]